MGECGALSLAENSTVVASQVCANTTITTTTTTTKSTISSAITTEINPTVTVIPASASRHPSFYHLLTSSLDSRRREIRSSHPGEVEKDLSSELPSLSYLQYRKVLKRVKRKMKRRIEAVTVGVEEREKRKKAADADAEGEEEEAEEDENAEEEIPPQDEQDELDEIERKLREHEAWLERERRAKKDFEEKKRKEEEERQRAEEELRKEAEDNELRINQAAIDAAKSVPAKPPPPTDLTDPNNCDFYMRTGACRYGDVCKRLHPEIEVGTKVSIPHMFDSTAFQAVFASPEGDVCLDKPDEELLKTFREFYEDVLPEFRKIGNVRQFKVCSNRVKHLRGNVYVEYELEEEAFVAAQVFGGRWYAGKQLSARVTVVRNWRQATCLQYLQNCCPKGIRCNFFHCFVNPNDEFADADVELEKEEVEAKKEKRDREKDHCLESNGPLTKERPSWRKDGRPPPKWKRSPSPPGKHRPFRFKDHYVDDDRIWKKGKDKKKGDEERIEKKEKEKDSDSDEDFCERTRKRQRHKERRRSSSGSDGGRRSSSNSSGSSSDEMGKKILKATLKSIKSKKSKKKSKKSSKKKSKKSKKSSKKKKREPEDSTDSSWESDASNDGD